jgi:hypothetical protein
MTNLSKYLNFENKRINHIFGGRYYPTIIKHQKYLMNVIRYIYQNPLRAGIVNDVITYEYSSLRTYLGISNPGICITPDLLTKNMFEQGLSGRDTWIKYIAHPLNEEDSKVLRKLLVHYTLKISKEQLKQLDLSTTTLVL